MRWESVDTTVDRRETTMIAYLDNGAEFARLARGEGRHRGKYVVTLADGRIAPWSSYPHAMAYIESEARAIESS